VPEKQQRLQRRVVDAAEAALRRRRYVAPIDVLVAIGWVPPSIAEQWLQGRLEYLESRASVPPDRLTEALELLRAWAEDRGLQPSETAYVARTRRREQLRFSASGEEAIEQAYRTHWLSPHLSDRRRASLAERQSRPPDLVVIWPLKDPECSLCGEICGFLLMEDSGPVCLTCADMDHLVFLAAGDATLSRRAKRASRLSAVVVRFSRARKRYERQGVLVEESALERAEAECLADEEVRARGREREARRREATDTAFHAELARRIRRLFPGCPSERADAIARHAGLRGSGRIGRSAQGQSLDPDAITLAVVASVRHEDTAYDELLMRGAGRDEARARVAPEVDRLLQRWRQRRDR
jgi:hypothetical protein